MEFYDDYPTIHKVKLYRPMNEKGEDIIDDFEVLGATLGIGFVQCALSDNMNGKTNVKLFEEEEERTRPPILFLLGLDGQLYIYYMFHDEYKDISCIQKP